MALSSNVWTVNLADSTHGFLPTQLITRKSMCCQVCTHLYYGLITICRVLLATVRDKGLCPCPRCLIRKVDIDKVGQKRDSRDRITKARTYLSDVIRTARRFIYDLGFNIDSAAVERVLKPQSLVPTLVRVWLT
jgi:hypothetical protein